MTERKATGRKRAIKLPDLTPGKDARGGARIESKNPPLQIPPPGFITPTENGEATGTRSST